jgi:hypothetical protein
VNGIILADPVSMAILYSAFGIGLFLGMTSVYCIMCYLQDKTEKFRREND